VSTEALQDQQPCGNTIVETPEKGRKDTVIRQLLVEVCGLLSLLAQKSNNNNFMLHSNSCCMIKVFHFSHDSSNNGLCDCNSACFYRRSIDKSHTGQESP